MNGPTDVWRLHLRLWLPALVFVLLNLAMLSAYRLVYAGQAQLRKARVERSRDRLEQVGAEREKLEGLVSRAVASQAAIDGFYRERLASERQRLTAVIAEVKRLASTAGLEPSTISYDRQELEEHGLLKRSIVFSVEGSYMELRRLINMLELTDSFLVLEQVGLSGRGPGGAGLRIDLRISTLFASPASEMRPPPVEASG